MSTRLDIGPYKFCSNSLGVRARTEDEAVQKAFDQLEAQGYDVIACTDVHRSGLVSGVAEKKA